jgi:catechol 2,3-dioxygenase-like lactoylglutathione lyase family enzyme
VLGTSGRSPSTFSTNTELSAIVGFLLAPIFTRMPARTRRKTNVNNTPTNAPRRNFLITLPAALHWKSSKRHSEAALGRDSAVNVTESLHRKAAYDRASYGRLPSQPYWIGAHWIGAGKELLDTTGMASHVSGREPGEPLGQVSPGLSESEIIAFVQTRDLSMAKPFYRDRLGLRLVTEDQFALVFDANGTTLRVAAVPGFTGANHTVLGWRVPNIAGTIEALQKAGVVFQHFPGMNQDTLGIWDSPSGAKVAWFKDPDGNTLSLTQF